MAVNMNDTYHSLLMDYAAGTLDEAYALVVAAHLALSPAARKMVAEYEQIGGGLLQEHCTPVAMCESALRTVLGRLDACAENKPERPCTQEEIRCAELKAMPSCLRAYMVAEDGHLPWKPHSTGIHAITLKTSCGGSRLRIYKIENGTALPRKEEKNCEILLILNGTLASNDLVYERGDLFAGDSTPAFETLAGRGEVCTFLAVGKMPENAINLLKSFFRPFRH